MASALLGFLVFDWDTSLNVSVAILAGFILATAAMTYIWIKPGLHRSGSQDGQPGEEGQTIEGPPPIPGPNAFADAAKLIITTQGVVLGLVAFTGPNHLSPTIKAGLASLVTGVLIASLLYLQVAVAAPADLLRRMIASILFNVLLWSLGFGLVCVVAGSWSS